MLLMEIISKFLFHLVFWFISQAIITRSLHTFYPLFEVHLSRPLALCMVSIQERVIVAHVQYFK